MWIKYSGVLMAGLIAMASYASAGMQIEMRGVEYLSEGEEVYHRTQTESIKQGDQVTLIDKRNGKSTRKAEVTLVNDSSILVKVLPSSQD